MRLAERELWACANAAIREHGFDAALVATGNADALLETGDVEGSLTWVLIRYRIETLLARSEDGTCH